MAICVQFQTGEKAISTAETVPKRNGPLFAKQTLSKQILLGVWGIRPWRWEIYAVPREKTQRVVEFPVTYHTNMVGASKVLWEQV